MPTVRDLTTEDFKNHNVADYSCSFDVLAAVAEVASSLYYEANKNQFIQQDSKPSSSSSFLIKNNQISSKTEKDAAFSLKNKNRPDFEGSMAIRKRPSLPIEDTDQLINTKKKRILKQSKAPDLGIFDYLRRRPIEVDLHLPIEFKDSITTFNQGLEIGKEILVIQKPLTASDISPQQNRFSIPLNQVVNNAAFLNDDELEILCSREDNGNKLKKLQLNLIDPLLKMKWSVKLARWVLKKPDPDKMLNAKSNERKGGCSSRGGASISYVINGPWMKIVESNELKVGDVMQLWGVRVQGSLWFLLVKLHD